MMQNSEELLVRVKDYRPESSVSALEEFIGGSIYWDFKNEIIARIEDMRDYNEENESKQYLETRGGIKAMRLISTIFEDLLAIRKSDLEESHG